MNFSLIEMKNGLERAALVEQGRSLYEEHQWLWKFFSGKDGQKRDFIYRKVKNEFGLPKFYVVSPSVPVRINSAWEVRTQTYRPIVESGGKFRFELRVNPVVTRKVQAGDLDNIKSRRDDVVISEKKKILDQYGVCKWSDLSALKDVKIDVHDLIYSSCLNWIRAREGKLGFRVFGGFRADSYTKNYPGKKSIVFSSVDVSGVLEVTSKEEFTKTLYTGIGRSKAFGCGLLLIKRVE